MVVSEHKPWDDPWSGVGIPESGYWTDERIMLADELVSDFLQSEFDRVVRDGLSAEHKVKERAVAEDIPLVLVSNEHNEIPPIRYDNRHLTPMATQDAIEYARGSDR